MAQILAVARSVLLESGYDGFVLRTIAERAGIALGNLQYYFPTREDLLEAVGRAENERALVRMRRIQAEEATPPEKIRRLVHEIVSDWQHEGGEIFAVLTMLAIHNPRFHAIYVENYSLFYDAIGDVLAELEPEAARADLMRKARLATSLLDGALLQIPIGPVRARRKEQNEFLAELGDAVLRLVGHEE